MTWIDTDTGEIAEDCPHCQQTRIDAETQIHAMELERRKDRAAVTRAQNQLAAAAESKRDGAIWKKSVAHWRATFPELKPTSLGVKSARATAYFQRLEAGALPEDVDLAVSAAKEYPYVVFGKRRRTGSRDDLAIDLQQIVSVGNDAQFDFLVSVGRKAEDDGLF
jgi:hypothetical protein